MTSCIAAACRSDDDREPCIVFCSDHRVETETAGSEIEFKYRWVKSDWPALIAGHVSESEDALATVSETLADKELTNSNVYDLFRAGMNAYKRKVADAYIQSTLAISYDHFLHYGKEQLSDEVFREVSWEVTRLSLNSQILTSGFPADGGRPLLVVLERNFSVTVFKHFATIGSGSNIANAALFQRGHAHLKPLSQTIYHVYEAQRLAQIAPGVGKKMTIIVAKPPAKPGERIMLGQVTAAGQRHLATLYNRLGLKKVGLFSLPVGDVDWGNR